MYPSISRTRSSASRQTYNLILALLVAVFSVSAHSTDYADPVSYRLYYSYAGKVFESSSASGACSAMGAWASQTFDDTWIFAPTGETYSSHFWTTFGAEVESGALYYYCDWWNAIYPPGEPGGGPPGNRWGIAAICPAGFTPLDSARCVRNSNEPDEDKNLGDPDYCPVGNPINQANGNKFQLESDYVSGANGFPLSFTRYYNSSTANKSISMGRMGRGWTNNYSRSIVAVERATAFVVGNTGSSTPTYVYDATVTINRPDGRSWTLRRASSEPLGSNPYWLDQRGLPGTLTQINSASGSVAGWKFVTNDDETESYDSAGRLISITNRSGLTQTLTYVAGRMSVVTDPFGRTLVFSYDGAGRLQTMTDPAGRIYTYTYGGAENLINVTYPDSTTKQYFYENTSLPGALTGIVDAKGVRYATWTYDALGRATSSSHANGVELVSITYSGSNSTVTDSLGNVRTYHFSNINGVHKLDSISEQCAACSTNTQWSSHDDDGNLTDVTDFNGNTTHYDYDARGLQTSRTLPDGSIIETQWHSALRVPVLITEPLKTTAFVYDAAGRLTSRTDTELATSAKRTWTYSYGSNGLVSTINGPRTDVNDVTTFSYDTSGNILSVTNAVGQATQFLAYDAHGRATSIGDANGLTVAIQYDTRSRVTSRNVGGEITSYTYDSNGNLQRVSLPSGAFLEYTYDDAHRITRIVDELGNRVDYTLDGVGNRTQERVYDPAGTLTKTHRRVFTDLNRLYQDIGAQNQTTTYAHDGNGNLIGLIDPLGRTTNLSYDSMNRVSFIESPLYGYTNIAYTLDGSVESVIDPKGLTNSFTTNGFREQTSSDFPDAGAKQLVRDSAGNITKSTDARGMMSNRTYDAKNRLTKVTYSDGKVDTFVYDTGTNGLGRLTKQTDESGSTDFSYDIHGRLIKAIQTIKTSATASKVLTTNYGYDAAGHLSQITYPSGMVVVYTYTFDRVTRVSVNGATLISNIGYMPDGQVKSWSWGSGVAYNRTYDLDGRLLTQSMGSGTRTIGYNAAGHISSVVDPYQNLGFAYDELGRIVSSTGTYARAYEYDENGNRTVQTAGSTVTNYDVDPPTNRLSDYWYGSTARTYTYDLAGNTLSDGLHTYVYDAKGRMVSLDSGATKYYYNAQFQRVRKLTGSTSTFFAYDQNSHLLGEYNNSAVLIQETIYLGNLPIGNWRSSTLYYVYADHLDTPRVVTTTTGTVVWRWSSEPFGNVTPTQTSFAYNLRFPGQYYDSESGLNYNYFRTYDPKTGRYLQSDPIGIGGGLNTYIYVTNNPVRRIDPLGLADCDYYSNRCTEDGGKYYCSAAPNLCQKWPDSARPPFSDKDWVECVRKCLQRKDYQCDPTPKQCSGAGIDAACNSRIHAECWTECF